MSEEEVMRVFEVQQCPGGMEKSGSCDSRDSRDGADNHGNRKETKAGTAGAVQGSTAGRGWW